MKRRIRKFYTGLNVIGDLDQPKPPYNGAGWSAVLHANRENRYNAKVTENLRNNNYVRGEIVLRSRTWENAQKALDLILSSRKLVAEDPDFLGEELVAFNDEEPEEIEYIEKRRIENQSLTLHNIPLACAIAAKASRKQSFTYAIMKYKFSLSLLPFRFMDSHPNMQLLRLSKFPCDHINFCHAIIACYSAIEDLNLHVKLGKEKSSWENGKWNEKVKKNLEVRLKNLGIDLSRPEYWILRGTARRIEKTRPVPKLDIEKLPWGNICIRDGEIEVIDAIAYASWLRDKLSAHGTTSLTDNISPYDVINVQSLTRRLILESLGFIIYFRHK